MRPTEADIQRFFYGAMCLGLAVDSPYIQENSVIGSGKIEVTDKEFLLVDQWCTGPHNNCFGITTISYNNRAVWNMHYCGHYNSEVIKLLHSLLKDEYYREHSQDNVEPHSFNGCRGPLHMLMSEKFAYVNVVGRHATFADFNGREEIINLETQQSSGRIKYIGLML